MAESFFERRKRELGVANSTGKSPEQQGSSFFESRKMELGLTPDTRTKTSSQESGKAILDKITPGLRAMSKPQTKVAATTKSPRLQNPTVPNPINTLVKTRDTLKKSNEATKGKDYSPTTKEKIGKTIKGIGQGLADFPNAFTDTASFGLTDAFARKVGVETKAEQEARNSRTGGKIGHYAGYAAPGGAADVTANLLVRPLIKNAPAAVKGFVRLGTGGALFQTADEARQALSGENKQTFGERAKDVSVAGAVGGTLGALGPLAKSLIQKGGKATTQLPQNKPVTNPASQQKLNKLQSFREEVDATDKKVKDFYDAMDAKYGVDNFEWSKMDRVRFALIESNANGAYYRLTDYEKKHFPNGLDEMAQSAAPTENGLKRLLTGAGNAVNELGDVATGGLNSRFSLGAGKSEAVSPTMKHIVSSTKNETKSLSAAAEKSYINTVDDIFALKQADDIAAQAKGRGLTPSESSHTLAMHSRGSDQITRQILTNKMVDRSGNVVGDGLKDVTSVVGKGNIRKFEDYALNRHAITRFPRGEKVYPDHMNWTPETGQAIVDGYEKQFPHFKEAAKSLETFQDNFNQHWRVDSGLVKPEVIAAWKKENPTYIPMNRSFTDLEKGGKGIRSKRGLAGQKDPTKQYGKGGSQRPIIKPIESTILNVDATVKAANRNWSMQALVKNIQEHPEEFKNLAEIVPDSPQLGSFKAIDLSTPAGMDEMLARLDENFTRALKSTRKDMDNIVPVMVNGEPVYVKLHNKNLLEAVTSINPQTLDAASKFASSITNTWKMILTGVNPIFTLTRSIFRDPVSAYVQSKSTNNPVRFVSDLAQGAWAVMRNKDLYKEYTALGGGFNSPNVGTPKLLNRTMRDIIPSERVMQGAVQRFGDKLGQALDRIEAIPRIGEYKRLRGTGTLDERLTALSEAKEVAVNFQRKGRTGRVLDAWFPYFNAAIQSMDKLARSFIDKPGATITKAGLSVTVPSILLYMKNHNDPNYQKLSESEKDRYLHIPLPNGKFFRFPLPQELTPFAAVPRRVLQQMAAKDPEAWKDFGNTMMQNFLPPGLQGAVDGFISDGIPGAAVGIASDTFAGPLVDVAANKTWNGVPIVPAYLQNVSPKLQSDARTSGLSKKISGITGGSPMQLDYLIRQYGGDLGNIGTSIAEKGALKGGAGILEGIGKRMVVDPAVSNDIMNNFYDLKDKNDKQYADAKATGVAPKGYDDEVRKFLDRTAGDMGEITKAIRSVDVMKLTDKEKRDKKVELTKMRNDLAQQAYQAVRSATK